MPDKSRFLEQKHNKKVVGLIIILNLLYSNPYKTCKLIVWIARKVDFNERNPNLKAVEFQSIKTFLLKDILQIVQKKFL